MIIRTSVTQRKHLPHKKLILQMLIGTSPPRGCSKVSGQLDVSFRVGGRDGAHRFIRAKCPGVDPVSRRNNKRESDQPAAQEKVVCEKGSAIVTGRSGRMFIVDNQQNL
jgi:hypothetical protein